MFMCTTIIVDTKKGFGMMLCLFKPRVSGKTNTSAHWTHYLHFPHKHNYCLSIRVWIQMNAANYMLYLGQCMWSPYISHQWAAKVQICTDLPYLPECLRLAYRKCGLLKWRLGTKFRYLALKIAVYVSIRFIRGICVYSKACVNGHSQKDQKCFFFKTGYRLM